MDKTGYPKTSTNTVVRYRNRGVYDYETINNIIDSTPILHVSFVPDAQNDEHDTEAYPVILPMMGFTGNFEDPDGEPNSPRSVYLHGYVSSRMMRTTRDREVTGANAVNDDDAGMRVCVAATLFDGVVLALTPNHHSCNYRSASAFGRAHIVHDEAERLWAMERITDNLVPGRWAATRYPSAAEQKATGIIRVEIHAASAKVRTGSTGEDRNDLKDTEMRRRVWAGVLPTYTAWGEPVAAETNLMPTTPQYLDNFIENTEAARRITEKHAYIIIDTYALNSGRTSVPFADKICKEAWVIRQGTEYQPTALY
ncbi:hypothetical protein FHL15_009928 [Xylaria flabelliformis]|uniref:Flavin-nucleotide-binding protein n=1 Tax=Xylaria flabelliformis TaxID=2512241 RepID=A0A553HMP0_9PEZI|nr:hypothetical protein FHL15_009928 [Xylaria flabelliformis]